MRRVAWLMAAALACAAVPASAQYSSADIRAAQAEAREAQASRAAAAAAERAGRSSIGIGMGTGTNIRSFGPIEPAPRYQPPPPSIGEAPAHLKYMSPRCSALHDALRTAHARGLRPETVSRMRRDYPGECAENESEAYAMLSQERRDKSIQKREAVVGEMRQRERTALQQEQCGESKRILVTKRARTDLTDGEKSELQRFEANYKARCS